MTIYCLMVKTHIITGLKYLCQTKKKDPFKYCGSGLEWTIHLKKYGKIIQTEILLQTESKQEINDVGRYYSKLWRITSSMDDFGNRIWANAIPETGGGPGMTKGIIPWNKGISQSEEEKEKRRGKIPWNKGIIMGPQSTESKQLRSLKMKGKSRPEEVKQKLRVPKSEEWKAALRKPKRKRQL
jgi:hypothetical protein